jgi:protein TonB
MIRHSFRAEPPLPQVFALPRGMKVVHPPSFPPLLRNAVIASVLLHVVFLSIKFTLPDPNRLRTPPQALEVILINSKSPTRPVKADAMAQANLDGGGNVDENRRAKSPLPVARQVERGDDVQRSQRRVQELEAQQRQLLAQARTPAPPVTQVQTPSPEPVREPQPAVPGVDLMNSALAMARMEAQIARQVEEYNKRPRKQFVGARAMESRFAQYVDSWRQKIERVGNLNYPDGARGRIYGSLRLTVAIKPDGTIEDVQVDRPSEYKILNDAALKIVRLATPFAAFPPEIRRDTDLLVITRTWTFAPGDRLYND